MNATQIAAMRNLWNDATAPKVERTAFDMAMTSHNLSKDGMKATTPDGAVWYWVAATERWTR